MDALPAVNATLNALAFCLLWAGFRRIRRRDIEGHKRCMLAAFATSSVFLACYLTYHALHGHTVFTHGGWAKVVYYVVLFTHIPLAGLMVVPILLLLVFGLRGRIDRHRRLARWTLPVWMYVSVTGVAIYFMLYHIWPAD